MKWKLQAANDIKCMHPSLLILYPIYHIIPYTI